VRILRNHLAEKEGIYGYGGDRLIDETTGIGIWEASFNNTHQAVI